MKKAWIIAGLLLAAVVVFGAVMLVSTSFREAEKTFAGATLTYSGTREGDAGTQKVYVDANKGEYTFDSADRLVTYTAGDLPDGTLTVTAETAPAVALSYLQQNFGERVDGYTLFNHSFVGESLGYYLFFGKQYGEEGCIVGSHVMVQLQTDGNVSSFAFFEVEVTADEAARLAEFSAADLLELAKAEAGIGEVTLNEVYVRVHEGQKALQIGYKSGEAPEVCYHVF